MGIPTLDEVLSKCLPQDVYKGLWRNGNSYEAFLVEDGRVVERLNFRMRHRLFGLNGFTIYGDTHHQNGTIGRYSRDFNPDGLYSSGSSGTHQLSRPLIEMLGKYKYDTRVRQPSLSA